nr:sigma-70 family RNA polymerase sigma factor [Halomonas socia]
MRQSKPLSPVEEVFVKDRIKIFNSVLKILANRELAEDVVHDAYLKVREAGAAVSVKQPAAYAFQVARCLAIDRYRRRALETGIFSGESDDTQGVTYSTPERIEIGREELRLVSRAMNSLPTRTRRAFELYRMAGYTQREVAEQLGVSTTLVNFMIRDALSHCRSSLSSE